MIGAPADRPFRSLYASADGAARSKLVPPPWPAELAPRPIPYSASATSRLPKADALVVTWTVAEHQALADVLTPGVRETAWLPYAEHFDQYLPNLTSKSPARGERCLARYALTQIAGRRVLVAKSNLHLSTDGVELPLRDLFRQAIDEVEPSLVVTTGTAGGVGADTQLGDVLVTGTAKFNCAKRFKAEPFAQARYQSTADRLKVSPALPDLLAANASSLAPSGLISRPITVYFDGHVQTVDYFAFADETDSYGVVANDPLTRMEEMDDAVLGLVVQEALGNSVPWLSIRNASDPQVPHMPTLREEAKWAGRIYERFGYWTSIGSAILSALAVAGT